MSTASIHYTDVEINNILDKANKLALSEQSIENTKQVIARDGRGRITKIQHQRISDDVLIREDTFSYTSTTITEIRRLDATGETITYKYNY